MSANILTTLIAKLNSLVLTDSTDSKEFQETLHAVISEKIHVITIVEPALNQHAAYLEQSILNTKKALAAAEKWEETARVRDLELSLKKAVHTFGQLKEMNARAVFFHSQRGLFFCYSDKQSEAIVEQLRQAGFQLIFLQKTIEKIVLA